jgi:pimeloyl-ACP methyl ester carboxylesterase
MARRNRALALGVAGLGAGVAAAAAYSAARRHRDDVLDLSELALPDDVEKLAVTVDDGTTIHGITVGSGQPIVLLHGVTLSVATWPYQVAALRKEFRVIALDARGHGLSKFVGAVSGLDRLASDVAQVFAQLDLRDAIVVGHSMGGMMTQQMVLDYPELARERIAGTILLSTAAAPGQGVPFARSTTRRWRPGTAIGRVALPAGEVGYAFARLALGAKADPRYVAHTRNMTGGTHPHTLSHVLPHVVGFDVRSRLKDYAVPALVITGSRDLLTPPRVGRELARRIPGAEFEVVPGAGHMLMMERAEWLNERITAFANAH